MSAQGVATEPNNIQVVTNWKTPTTIKVVRRLLGLAAYYMRFVHNFRVIAKPLFQMLKKDVPFVWAQATHTAFQLLKHQLVLAPILSLPNFSRSFCIKTDACHQGIGAVLQQNGHPVAFMSKVSPPRYHVISTYEKEYLAVVIAVD